MSLHNTIPGTEKDPISQKLQALDPAEQRTLRKPFQTKYLQRGDIIPAVFEYEPARHETHTLASAAPVRLSCEHQDCKHQ